MLKIVILALVLPLWAFAEKTNLNVNFIYDYSEVKGSNALPDRAWYSIMHKTNAQYFLFYDARKIGYAQPSVISLASNTVAANAWFSKTNNIDADVVAFTNEIISQAACEVHIDIFEELRTNSARMGSITVSSFLDRLKSKLRGR